MVTSMSSGTYSSFAETSELSLSDPLNATPEEVRRLQDAIIRQAKQIDHIVRSKQRKPCDSLAEETFSLLRSELSVNLALRTQLVKQQNDIAAQQDFFREYQQMYPGAEPSFLCVLKTLRKCSRHSVEQIKAELMESKSDLIMKETEFSIMLAEEKARLEAVNRVKDRLEEELRLKTADGTTSKLQEKRIGDLNCTISQLKRELQGVTLQLEEKERELYTAMERQKQAEDDRAILQQRLEKKREQFRELRRGIHYREQQLDQEAQIAKRNEVLSERIRRLEEQNSSLMEENEVLKEQQRRLSYSLEAEEAEIARLRAILEDAYHHP